MSNHTWTMRRPILGLVILLATIVTLLPVLLFLSVTTVGATPSAYSVLCSCSGQNSNGAVLVYEKALRRDITTSCAPAGSMVSRVDVTVSLDHNCSGDLNVRLDNSHRSSFLQTHATCGGDTSGPQILTFTTNYYDGDPVDDTWKLFVTDWCAPCGGYFNSWSIRVYYSTAVDTPSPTPSITPTDTPRVSATPTNTPLVTNTLGATASVTVTLHTPTFTSIPRQTHTPTSTARPVNTPTFTREMTATPTRGTPTATPTEQPGCEHLAADFDFTTLCLFTVHFADKSTSATSDPITSWEWDFGDGHTSSLQNPQHTFAQAGTYPVRLTVRTRDGCEKTVITEFPAIMANWVLSKELIAPVGRPVYVGDLLTYTITLESLAPHSIAGHRLLDTYHPDYFDYVSASPSPDSFIPGLFSRMDVTWLNQGAIPVGSQRQWTITLRAKRPVTPTILAGTCNQASAVVWFEPKPICAYITSDYECIEILPRASGLHLEKNLVDPPGGVANVGDIVEYEIRIENVGIDPVTIPHVDDFFDVNDFDYVSASPPPDFKVILGGTHYLVWQNQTVLGGDTLVYHVRLRARRPGQKLINCVSYPVPPPEEAPPPGVHTLSVDLDCAELTVEAPVDRDFAVYKRFTIPSNHIAYVGDWVTFETAGTYLGSDPASDMTVRDDITPPSVLLPGFFPIIAGTSGPLQPGSAFLLQVTFQTHGPAMPAINTAEWTVTWPDGSKQTKTVQDYVYVLEPGTVPRGLAVGKVLADPIGGAAISDTLTYRVTITNTGGLTLTNVSLNDTFDPGCLSYVGASLVPDVVTAGTITWNNLGTLDPGQNLALDVQFHADAPCAPAWNCSQVTGQAPDGTTLVAADCTPADIEGERPHLTIVKRRISPSPVSVGQHVDYEIEIHNGGAAPVAMVPLHDRYELPHLGFVSASPPPDVNDPTVGLLEWHDLGPLQPGQMHVVSIRLEAVVPGLARLNCAETIYHVGPQPTIASDCDTVDIITEEPAIQVEKVRAWPDPSKPVALGGTVAFTVTLRNVGGTPLNNVSVTDAYDSGCLEFFNAPAMPTAILSPNEVRWDLGTLLPGEELSWLVIFRAVGACAPIANCVIASGEAPDGNPVHAESCVELDIQPPEPDISLRKHVVGLTRLPQVGDVIRFEVLVQNTGNTPLIEVPMADVYDRDCLEFITAAPMPDFGDPGAGFMRWTNLGPLQPGDAHVVHLAFRSLAPCWPVRNCAESVAVDIGQVEVGAADCADTWIAAAPEGRVLYLPLVLKEDVGQS